MEEEVSMKTTALTLVAAVILGFSVPGYGQESVQHRDVLDPVMTVQQRDVLEPQTNPSDRDVLDPQMNERFKEPVNAQNIRITITNVTPGQVLTPPLVVLHSGSFRLFTPGQPASEELAMLAEEGLADQLVSTFHRNSDVYDFTVADRELMPGESIVLELKALDVPVGPNEVRLSVAGMLATTNDGFYAVNGAQVTAGKFLLEEGSWVALAYDAGSEFNNESCDFIPGEPCGSHFARDRAEAEGFVHVHSGIHGTGDLDPAEWSWNNPVAWVTFSTGF
jgi:hypothetical protein